MMGSIAEQNWIVAQHMAEEAKMAGLAVDRVMNLLRSAKVLLNECRLDAHARIGLLPRASTLIEDAQRDLFLAAEHLETDLTEKWTAELKKVFSGEKVGEFTVTGSSKFYSGMPRDGKWVRIAIPISLKGKLKDIEDKAGVKIRQDGDSHVLIAGEKSAIRKALNAMSPYFKSK